MAFLKSKLKYLAYAMVIGLSFAISMPFFNLQTYAYSSMYAIGGTNATYDWNNNTDEIISIYLSNGNKIGYLTANAFSGGNIGTSGENFTFGFVPYYAEYEGSQEELSIDVLIGANFTIYLTLPMALSSAGYSNYTQRIPIIVGFNPVDRSYTNGFFSEQGLTVNGVTFSCGVASNYFRMRAYTSQNNGAIVHTGNYFNDDGSTNWDYVAQTLSYLRKNNPTYFNGGKNVESRKYNWFCFLEDGKDYDIDILQNNINSSIQNSQENIQDSIAGVESNIQNSITNTENNIQSGINNSTSEIQGTINNGFQDLIDQNSGAFDDFNQDMDDLIGGVGGDLDIIDGVDKPSSSDVGDLATDVINGILANEAASNMINSIFNMLLGQNVILVLILVSLSVGLIKYLFFGKS